MLVGIQIHSSYLRLNLFGSVWIIEVESDEVMDTNFC